MHTLYGLLCLYVFHAFLVFSMAEMVPQVLKVAYNIASYAKIATPAIVYTAISFLVSFQALSAPLCLLAIRYVNEWGNYQCP